MHHHVVGVEIVDDSESLDRDREGSDVARGVLGYLANGDVCLEDQSLLFVVFLQEILKWRLDRLERRDGRVPVERHLTQVLQDSRRRWDFEHGAADEFAVQGGHAGFQEKQLVAVKDDLVEDDHWLFSRTQRQVGVVDPRVVDRGAVHRSDVAAPHEAGQVVVLRHRNRAAAGHIQVVRCDAAGKRSQVGVCDDTVKLRHQVVHGGIDIGCDPAVCGLGEGRPVERAVGGDMGAAEAHRNLARGVVHRDRSRSNVAHRRRDVVVVAGKQDGDHAVVGRAWIGRVQQCGRVVVHHVHQTGSLLAVAGVGGHAQRALGNAPAQRRAIR